MAKSKSNIIREYIRAHRPQIVFILAVSVVLGFFRMYSTVYIEYLTDAIEMQRAEVLGRMVVIACVLQAAFYFLRWVVAVTAARFNEEVAYIYRVHLMAHIKKIPYREYEKLSSGNLQTIIRTDSQNASKYMYIVFSRILPNVFILVFSYAYLFSIDVAGSIAMIVISSLLYVINRRISSVIEARNIEQRTLAGVINDIVVKVCQLFDAIKVNRCSDYMLEHYDRKRDEYNRATLAVEKVWIKNDMVLSFVSNACLLTAAVLLSWKAIAGQSSVGEVLAYITTLSQATICVTTILGWMASLARAKASIARLDSILEIEAEKQEKEAEVEDVKEICFTDISYSYDEEVKIIDQLQLNLQKGNVYQIIGESGSGKTTLLKLLMGLYQSGTAGISVNGRPVASVRKLVGYVPANPNLFHASIYENITMGAEVSRERCLEAAKQLGLSEWIDSLEDGLDHVIDRNAGNISGGQKQGLAILRALVMDCPVIILDEPFSALDKQREEKLSEIIHQIRKDKIIIITSHRDCMPGEQITNVVLE